MRGFRRPQYEKRLIHDGPQAYRRSCAVRIQAAVRGYFTRKWYRVDPLPCSGEETVRLQQSDC
jgi:hypothetical protein